MNKNKGRGFEIEIIEYDKSMREDVLRFYRELPAEDIYKRFFGVCKDFECYVDNLEGKDGIILVARYGERIIGVCEAYPVNESEWEVAIIVDKEFRRRGVGRRLLTEIALRIRDMGGRILFGIINRSNTEAIKACMKLGCKAESYDYQTVKLFYILQ